MRMLDPIRRTSPAPRRRVMKIVPVVLVGGLALAGCAPDYFDEGNATRTLLLTGVNEGNVLNSDVRTGTNICPDIVPVRVENHAKNPNAPASGFRDDIVVERYEVRYSRSDGRGTEGVDVPFRISGNLSFEIIGEASANVPIEVVRRQAKLEPPLSQLVDGGGGFIVTMFAEVTLWARTTTGVATNTASGRMQIDFADYVGTSDLCETN
jgi:hypothetical protein